MEKIICPTYNLCIMDIYHTLPDEDRYYYHLEVAVFAYKSDFMLTLTLKGTRVSFSWSTEDDVFTSSISFPNKKKAVIQALEAFTYIYMEREKVKPSFYKINI